MLAKTRPGRYFWVLGGLALGGLAGLVVGTLVFWVYPALQKARSPIGEFARPPLVLRYLKDSPFVSDILAVAEKLQGAWTEVLKTLKLPEDLMLTKIYLYVYSSPTEIATGISTRLEEENTPLAVVDTLLGRPMNGELARLACALAFGRPGNALIPRGVALYLDNTQYPWAEEAWTWADRFSVQEVWSRANQLLPYDPWEALYFQINAPWASATLTLEKMRTVLTALSQTKRGGGRVGEVFAAALVHWILLNFGPEELRIFWRAPTWEAAALGLRQDPHSLAQEFLDFLHEEFDRYGEKAHLLALKALHSGRASQALSILEGFDDPSAREIKGLAYLALGKIQEALDLADLQIPDLAQLTSTPAWIDEQIVLVGGEGDCAQWISRAKAVLNRAATIWPDLVTLLPERLTFYVGESAQISLPWGTTWVRSVQEIPGISARLVLEAASPLGLPTFSTLVEGLVLWLTQPERDFREEAKNVLEQGRWVSLTQTLFGVYPEWLAEAESGAFVKFILEAYGPAQLRCLWQTTTQGASPFRAAEICLDLAFSTLEERLLAWIRQP